MRNLGVLGMMSSSLSVLPEFPVLALASLAASRRRPPDHLNNYQTRITSSPAVTIDRSCESLKGCVSFSERS